MCICCTMGDILPIASGEELLLSPVSQKLDICLAALWQLSNSAKCSTNVCTDTENLALLQQVSWLSPSHGAPSMHECRARPRVWTCLVSERSRACAAQRPRDPAALQKQKTFFLTCPSTLSEVVHWDFSASHFILCPRLMDLGGKRQKWLILMPQLYSVLSFRYLLFFCLYCCIFLLNTAFSIEETGKRRTGRVKGQAAQPVTSEELLRKWLRNEEQLLWAA